MAYDDLKGEILGRFSKNPTMTFTGSLARARFESKNGNGVNGNGVRLVVSVSKRHNLPSGLYWYGFNQSQIDFLDKATKQGYRGYFIMVFSDSKRAFAIPHEEMKQMANEMNSTDYKSGKNYQVIVKLFEGREVIYASRTGSRFEFLRYEF